MSSSETLTVSQAGATGPVASLFRHYLQDPRLRMDLGDVAASREENVGKALGNLDPACPPQWAEKRLISPSQLVESDAPVIFSSLRTEAAQEHEDELARGRLLVTNAAAHRMRPDVALVNPFINPAHLDELFNSDQDGRIAAGGNCGVNIGGVVLAALMKQGINVQKMSIETLQGWSGTGVMTVPQSKDGKIIRIDGNNFEEAEKLSTEPNKFLGAAIDSPAHIVITAHPNRAPWVRGHHLKMTATLDRQTNVAEMHELLRSYHAPVELEAIKTELQALGQMQRKHWPHRYEQWPGKHQPIKPVKLIYASPVRWDTQPIDLPKVYPMRAMGYVKEVDEADPRKVVLEAAGDNLVLGAVGNNLLNIMYARLKGYV